MDSVQWKEEVWQRERREQETIQGTAGMVAYRKPMKWSAVLHGLLMAALLCISPLLGAASLDRPLGPYLEFPPTTRYVVHANFSWPIFVLLLFFITGICIPILYRFITYSASHGKRQTTRHPLPWWSWLGVAVIVVTWVLAWNRFIFFQPLQRFTFFPLWAGYILVVNGLTWRRQGSCLLRSRGRVFMVLFPVSALFWWYFEYLNRFVQNWYYVGGENISAAEYVIHASICFSTVLPAVFSTCELLGTFSLLTGAFAQWRPVIVPGRQWAGMILLAGSALSLSGLAYFPDYLFPLVWISPLLIIVGTQLFTGRPTIFGGLAKGDWRQIVLPALAALVCGFFWELWNWKSLAHWEYSVPFVQRFHLFAMPLLGYAGYLPFGLQCIAAGTLVGTAAGLEAEVVHTAAPCNPGNA